MRRHANQPMLCLLAVLVALCSRGALAHGGGLHRWTFNTDVLKIVPTAVIHTDAHVKLATCGNWTALNLTALIPSLFSFPWPAPQLNMTLEGNVDLVSYLPSNCSNSINGGLFPDLQFRVWIKQGTKWVSRPPPAGYQAAGYAFTGNCAAPGNLYRNNVTLLDNRFNLGWWGMDSDSVIGLGMNTSDIYPGYMWGAGVNSWFYRNSTNPDRAKSVVVFAQAGPAFCCNINYDGYPAPDSVLEQGHNCSVLPQT